MSCIRLSPPYYPNSGYEAWEEQLTLVGCNNNPSRVKIQLYIDIYNTRISHPYVVILLGMADIKACFCFPRIHPDLTGAFGFLAGGFNNLATAMVFGSTTSASS